MCKNIADSITNPKVYDTADSWIDNAQNSFMEGVYDIEWITHQDHSYKAARLLVAGGGPNIWVNTQTGDVEGYWASDKCTWGFVDNIGLDDYLEEMHGCK